MPGHAFVPMLVSVLLAASLFDPSWSSRFHRHLNQRICSPENISLGVLP